MGTSRLPIFQERFKDLRGEMTQGQFAEKLGISRPTVGLYESGARIPDAEILRDIAEKCGVSADYLIGLAEDPTNDAELSAVLDYTGLSTEAVSALRRIKEQGEDRQVMNVFLSEYGLFFAHYLNRLRLDTLGVEDEISKVLEKQDGKPIDLFNQLQVIRSALQLGAFNFSEYCREIADYYGVYDLVREVDYAIEEIIERSADDGEHTED